MRTKVLLFLLLFFYAKPLYTQETITRTKYGIWDLHALRYYPFGKSADTIVKQAIARRFAVPFQETPYFYKKTSLDMVINRQYLESQTGPAKSFDDVISRFFLKYYGSWLFHCHPLDKNAYDLDLTLFLSETRKNETLKTETAGIFHFIETDEMRYFLDEWTGSADLQKNKSEIFSYYYKNPLGKDALKIYYYFLAGEKTIDDILAYEIAFYSKRPEENAFEGYIYLSKTDLSFVKAVFTQNYLSKQDVVNETLFTRSPSKNEDLFYLGDDAKLGFLLKRTTFPSVHPQDTIPSPTLSQQELPALIEVSKRTRAYKNLQKAGMFLLNHKIGIVGDKFELGPLSHALSYNEMEGARLRFGANTTTNLNRHILLGGYVAYGLKDEKTKFRGDISYSSCRNDRLDFTIASDLNIPGHNLLDDKRDVIFYAIKHLGGDYMSLQKIGLLSFEKFLSSCFSAKISAKYTYDKPEGLMQYTLTDPALKNIKRIIPSITNTEIGISLHYAPGEKFIRVRDKRIVFRKSDIDFKINHRIGIKGVLGSEYNYRITDFSAYKKVFLPQNTGSFDIFLSGGKVWNRVPFPLLFIPTGNQSRLIYDSEEYNLLHLYEGISDRFIAGNANIAFNWSPVNIFYAKSKIKTNIGLKTFCGSMSDNNKPDLHPELFDFQDIITPMGKQPYTEGNIGLSNIFQLLRLDYVYRFGSTNKGAVFFSLNFPF
jgi:hypothetical protein